MTIATFKMSDIKPLLQEIKDHLDAKRPFLPTSQMLFDPALHKDGILRDAKGRTQEEAGDLFWPSSDNMDPDKIGPVIRIVSDHGTYLITNALFEEEDKNSPRKRGTIAHAQGSEQEDDPLAGGHDDDWVIDLPLGWFIDAYEKKKATVQILITHDGVELINS